MTVLPTSPGYVSVAPLREAFERLRPLPLCKNGYQPRDAAQLVAKRLNWTHHGGWPDGPRVRRVLGLRPYPAGRGRPAATQQCITYDMAIRLCEAMDLDPVDLGL